MKNVLKKAGMDESERRRARRLASARAQAGAQWKRRDAGGSEREPSVSAAVKLVLATQQTKQEDPEHFTFRVLTWVSLPPLLHAQIVLAEASGLLSNPARAHEIHTYSLDRQRVFQPVCRQQLMAAVPRAELFRRG
jgi:hypothetical protein